MISAKQLAANRRNARRSTGPRTPAGKQRTSLNGLRHGLAGQCNILPNEDRAAHDRFCATLTDCLRPGGPLQQQLAQSIAEDNWRLNRASALETNLFARGFLEDSSRFALLSIYEQRIHRNLHKNMQQLRDLQTV